MIITIPDELDEFVRAKLQAGGFENPAAVVAAALTCAVLDGRVHAPPHWLQAVWPLTTKLSFPLQKRRCQVLNLAMRINPVL